MSALHASLEVQPRPGETERQARVRAMAERIRAEARGGAGGLESPAAAATEQRDPAEDAKRLESMLPKLEESVLAAEDEAERAEILAAPLSAGMSDGLKELQLTAIRDTERAVKAALQTVSRARQELEAGVKEVEAMSPSVRDGAREEVAKLPPRLDAAQARLERHRNVRRDYDMAVQAEKLLADLAPRLASAEVHCEKATAAAEPLARALAASAEEPPEAEAREAREAVRAASALLAPTLRLITTRAASLKGPAHGRMLELQAQGEASQSQLDKAQRIVEEAGAKAAAFPLLKQSRERVAAADAAMHGMRETEAPFLMGLEALPPGESNEVLSGMDRAASAAQAALADARRFLTSKAFEVGRLTGAVGESAKCEIERLRKRVDEGLERVKSFQALAARRRQASLASAIHARVAEAQGMVLGLREAALQLQSAEPTMLAKVLEQAHAAELQAQNALAAARRGFQEWRQDMRPLDGGASASSAWFDCKAKIQHMETELARFRGLAKEFEERLRIGRSLAGLLEGLVSVERETEQLAAAPVDRPPTSGEVRAVEARLSSATMPLEKRLQRAQGLELLELRGALARFRTVQARLEGVRAAAHERGRASSQRVAREAAETQERAEASSAALAVACAALEALPMAQLQELQAQAREASELLAVAKQAVAQGEAMDVQSKVEFARLQLKLQDVERTNRSSADAIAAQLEKAAAEAVRQALSALRRAARRADGTYDAERLFLEFANGSDRVSEASLERALQASGRQPLAADAAKLVFRELAPHGTLDRHSFVTGLAEHFEVPRGGLSLSSTFEVQGAEQIRSLEAGEFLEALGEAKEDANHGLERVRCRSLRDGSIGWVGAAVLLRAAKPFMWCTESDTLLRTTEEPHSTVLRKLEVGEVLEFLEGPREVRLSLDVRVRGVTCGEEAAGWLQVHDSAGAELARLSTAIHLCRAPIAMTDIADLARCAIIRRVDTGEALELLSDEEVRPSEGGSRRRFRACRDGAEGWVSITGSQGTLYVAPATRHYLCAQAAPLHAGLGADSPVLQVLLPGQAFAAFEAPKEVSGGKRLDLYRVRARSDGKVGWVASGDGGARAWAGRYEVLEPQPLETEAAGSGGDAPVRHLERGELVQLSGRPEECPASGRLRSRCVALRDQAGGWLTARAGRGAEALLLRPCGTSRAAEGPPCASEADGEDGAAAASIPASLRLAAGLVGGKRRF